MEQALAKIRPHVSSSLPHQKAPASLLIALESTLKEQNAEPTPTAYFAALLTTLDSTVQSNNLTLGDGDILPAELYLLALVGPFVPLPVVRSNLKTLLALTAPLFPSLHPHAPPLRSQLSLYQVVFMSLDRSLLDAQGLRQTFASILEICLDPRPKVRKKAADLVKEVISSPPPPFGTHPYAEKVAAWVAATLTQLHVSATGRTKSGNLGADDAVHLLAFLRPIMQHLPSSVSNSYIILALNINFL
jgi:ribosomal RNA-processing protein 12